MDTSWPGWQEWDSSHPNSSTRKAGTTNETYDTDYYEVLEECYIDYESLGEPELANTDTTPTWFQMRWTMITKNTQSSTNNWIERCPDGKANGGEKSSSDITDDVGDEDGKDNNDTATPRSGCRNGESGDAGNNNEDEDGSKQEDQARVVATIREVPCNDKE